jgi:hypothetical protein
MDTSIFSDTPCGPLKSTDVSEEHVASASYLPQAGFLLGLFFDPEVGGDIFLQRVQLPSLSSGQFDASLRIFMFRYRKL